MKNLKGFAIIFGANEIRAVIFVKPLKHIVDTTLRDGEQSPGYALSKEQKVFIAKLLDDAGVFQIEAGIPALGPYEKDALCEIVDSRKNAKISVWNRLNESDIRHSFDCRPDIIHISAPVSYAQIYTKLRKNKAWIIKQLSVCIDLAKSMGYEVTVGFEDASRADITFLSALASAVMEMGVKRVRLADTVGVLMPSRCFGMVKDLIGCTGIEVEMHAHNDLGMAVANSIAAGKAGADYIDTTLFGIGERCGNCDMKKFICASEAVFSLKISRLVSEMLEESTFDLLVK